MLEERQYFPFEKIGVSLVCMRWTLVNSVTGCKRLRLASDLPAVKQQAGWNRLRFTNWGRKYLLGSPGRIQLPEDSSSGSCMFSDRKTRNLEDFHIEIAAGSWIAEQWKHLKWGAFLLCISSQIASGLACYVREHKLNFRNREMRNNNVLLLRATSHLFQKFEEFPY